MTPVQCNSCHAVFPGYQELAVHISHSKKGHRRGKRWASKFLLVNSLSAKQKRNNGDRPPPLTEEQKEAKHDSRRELSGRSETVPTICPRCKHRAYAVLPVEHTKNPIAWRISGLLAIICGGC